MFCKIGEIVCLNECKDALVAFVWFFSTVCFQMLSPIVCLHTYNHTCCIVTRWNGFSPECFLCDLSNRCRKSYICHTNDRRNVLKSFFHFRSGASKINLTRGNPVSFKCPTCSELETGFYNVALVWELIVAVVTLKYCSCWLWFTLTFHIGHIHTVFYTGMLSLSLTFWQQVVPAVSSGSFWGSSWTQQRSRSWWRLWEHSRWWRCRRATWLW